MLAAELANVTAPLRLPSLVNVFAAVPVKLIAVAPVALIWVLAPMVVAVTTPSVTCNPVPRPGATVILRLAPERSTPPPLAFIPMPLPETLISNAAGFRALIAALVVAMPLPVPVTLRMLRPLALLAKVKPSRLFNAVPFAVLSVTWLNARLTPAAFEKAAPEPLRFKIKSANA